MLDFVGCSACLTFCLLFDLLYHVTIVYIGSTWSCNTMQIYMIWIFTVLFSTISTYSGFGAMGKTQSPCYKCGQNCSPVEILPPEYRRRPRSNNNHRCTASNCYNNNRKEAGRKLKLANATLMGCCDNRYIHISKPFKSRFTLSDSI